VTRRTALPARCAIAPLTALAALSIGCALGGGNRPAPRLYDFGPAPRIEAATLPVSLGTVRAAPTLAGTEIRYRFASTPYQARAYGESRWLAPPADLLADRLNTALSRSSGGNGFIATAAPAPLRLVVEISTFEQLFDAPERARALLRVVAEVHDSRTRLTVARRTIATERETPTADAAGAVTALVELADEAVAELVRWLGEIEPPPAPADGAPGEPGASSPGEPPPD
jgi:cholesterol transport system auxiliary component